MSVASPARRFLFILVLSSIVLLAFVIRPVAIALFLAAVVSVVLAPLQERLARWLGGRRSLSALILVLAVLVILVGPLAGLSVVVVKEASDALRFVLDTVRSEGVAGLVMRMPEPLQYIAQSVLRYLGDLNQLIEKYMSEHGGKAATVLGAALAITGSLIFDLAMMLIALFFFLTGGDKLLHWIDSVSPLRRGQTRELLADFRKVSYAVIMSSLVTAGVQTLAAFIGYAIAKVPHMAFFTALTFFAALIPAIGAATVCLFAAAVVALAGHLYMAALLAVWGLVVVGLVDNVVKPYLIKDEIEMAGAVVFFALIGGLGAFGLPGLLIGPLAVSLFLTLLRMYQRDYGAKA
jgi:predicted PurR-regulated permease PerM